MHNDLLTELEKCVDGHRLADVIDALSCVCFAKAMHIAEAWQDNDLAKRWHRAGAALSMTAARRVFKEV